MERKLHFVMVHGLGGGAWCWYKIRCLLESSGYQVTCLDLKSAGIDCSYPDSVLKFQDYTQPLIDFFSVLPENEKVILVGHSAGGMSVTDCIHRFGGKIAVAVYVAATMLKHGFATDQDLDEGVPQILRNREGADRPPTTNMSRVEFDRKFVYHMSPKEDYTLAMMLSRPGPIRAMEGAEFRRGGGEGGGRDGGDGEEVLRVYIKTTRDLLMKPEQQEAMIKRWPPTAVFELDSDHAPFFSTPFLLCGFLLRAAALC